jgi:transmembrane sensor
LTEESNHIDNLIARYLTGEASDDERLRLEQWMNASEENKKYFGDIRFLHDKTVASHKIVRVNVDSAWSNLRNQMQQRTVSKKVIKKVSFEINVWFRVAAVIVLVLGAAFWLYKTDRIKKSQPISIVSQNHTITHYLEDSSQVFLNRKSKITYVKGFGKKQREVNLSGEAYFKVVHSKDKPFIVEAEGVLVKDLGTSFNIKAYSGDSIVEVYVESGEVAFFTKENPGVLLFKGEKGIFEKTTKTFRKFIVREPNSISYKTKVFVFHDALLSDVIKKLNAVYQANITFNNDMLMNCKITVTFDNENIDAIVGIISETMHLQLSKTSDGYVLEGDSCSQ